MTEVNTNRSHSKNDSDALRGQMREFARLMPESGRRGEGARRFVPGEDRMGIKRMTDGKERIDEPQSRRRCVVFTAASKAGDNFPEYQQSRRE